MIICHRCKQAFDLDDENVEAYYTDSGKKRWRHVKCEELQ